MWGSLRSSGKGPSRSIVESRDDVDARSPDVDTGTKVRKGSLGIVDGRGCDGDSLLDASRGGVGSVLVVVSGSDDNGNTEVKELK